MSNELVLRFRAPDRPKIVSRVTTLVAKIGGDIRAAKIFGDPDTRHFFCRLELRCPIDQNALATALRPLADELELIWEIKDHARKSRVLIAVSKFGHCMIDLIHKQQIGQLPIEIVGVVSNHELLRKTVEWHGIPYHFLPMSIGKYEQEAQFLKIVRNTNAEIVALARYMQILSNDFAETLGGICINIHHSFLPSFKGAKPYHQAHSRGVKLIGATAHFVTSELDEGPIIEQDVRRVNHEISADEMVAIGRDIEASVLSRAIRWHAEHRVFQNGNRTVIL